MLSECNLKSVVEKPTFYLNERELEYFCLAVKRNLAVSARTLSC